MPGEGLPPPVDVGGMPPAGTISPPGSEPVPDAAMAPVEGFPGEPAVPGASSLPGEEEAYPLAQGLSLFLKAGLHHG